MLRFSKSDPFLSFYQYLEFYSTILYNSSPIQKLTSYSTTFMKGNTLNYSFN
jgi:hypothetical protein